MFSQRPDNDTNDCDPKDRWEVQWTMNPGDSHSRGDMNHRDLVLWMENLMDIPGNLRGFKVARYRVS